MTWIGGKITKRGGAKRGGTRRRPFLFHRAVGELRRVAIERRERLGGGPGAERLLRLEQQRQLAIERGRFRRRRLRGRRDDGLRALTCRRRRGRGTTGSGSSGRRSTGRWLRAAASG